MAFNPINTQEEFDAAVAERLNRERAKFADYEHLKSSVSELTEKVNGFATVEKTYKDKIGELNGKIAGYETDSAKTRIAIEMGLPLELRGRLNGSTEEEIRTDAKVLADLLNAGRRTAPLADPEQKPTADDPWKQLSADMAKQI